jgi:hypothetical protein
LSNALAIGAAAEAGQRIVAQALPEGVAKIMPVAVLD